MDFHSLVRKDLQSLCKLNKIPANRTNVMMAEALSSLKTVKGIEKYCKSSESSVAESSVESPEKNVVTSPKTTRTGRRKQVRKATGVVQTVTPFTRRKIRSPVASVRTVQRVYNTRLSTRLLKKESMGSGKKECAEAVKISSYCDVASDNDFGEVFEEKDISGSDNVGVELPVSEIEQEGECLKWKDADSDLDSRVKAAANFKFKVPENNGLQVDTIEAILELPSDDNMVVKENPLHNEKGSVILSKSGDCLRLSDDVGVDLCLSKTNSLTEVLAHEGSVDVGAELPVFKIEQEIESLKGEDAYKDLDSAVTKMKQVLGNNALQVDTVEAVLEMPSDDNMFVIDKPIHKQKDVVGVDLCISKTDISTEVFAHEGSVDVVVESPFSEIEQECVPLKWNGADKDLDLSDTKNMKSKVVENNGLEVDTMLESVLEMPSDDSMMVIDKPLYNEKDDGGDNLCLSKTDIPAEVFAHEGSVYVGVESPISEIEQESECLKGSGADKDISGSDNVGVELPFSEIDQEECKFADKDLDSRDKAAANFKFKVPENNALQVDTVEAVLEMPSDDYMVVIDEPIHKKKDDVGVDFCISKTDISTEVLAHEGSVDVVVESPFSEIEQECVPLKWNGADKDLDLSDTKNMKSKVVENNGLEVDTMLESILEMPSDDSMMVIDKPLYNEKDDVGVNLCLSKTDIPAEVFAHEGSVYVGVESPVSEIEQERKCLKGSGADKDLDLCDTAMTNMNSKVLENNGLQVDTMLESVLEMPSNDNMVVIDKPLHNKKDDEVDLCLCKTDVSTEVLAHGVNVFQMNTDTSVVETPTNEKKAAIPSIFLQEEGSVVVGSPFPEKEFQSESPKGVYGEGLDVQVTALTDMKVLVLNGKGSCNVGDDSPVSEIEEKSESLNLKSADKDLDLRDPTATKMKPEVLENSGLQVDTVEAVLEMPSNNNMAVVDQALNNKEGECLKRKDADKDLDSRVRAAANFKSKVPENNGLQVDTIEAILEMPKEKSLHHKKGSVTLSKSGDCLSLSDDVGVDLCLSKTNFLTEVLAHEGPVDVGVELPVFKIEQEIESLKGEDAYKDLDSRDIAVTKMKQVLENNALQVDTVEAVLEMPSDDYMVVIDEPIHKKKDDVGVDFCISKTDISTEVLAHEGAVDVVVESPVSEIEQECLSLKWNGADKDLDLSDTKNMKSKELENNGLQVNTMLESVLEMPSDDNMVVIDKPLHNKKDDEVDLCLCKTDVSTEVLAHGVNVFQMNTDTSVVEKPTNEKKAAIPSIFLQEEGSVDVGFPFPEKEFQCESPKGVYGESLDVQVTALTDLKVLVLNGKGSCNVGVDSPVSEIEEKSESLNLKSAEKDLDLRDPTATKMKPEVLEKCGLQVDTVEAVLEMPSNDNMAVVDQALNNKDDVGVDLNLSKTDVSIEVLVNDVEGFQVVPLKPLAEMPSHDNKAVVDMPHHKKNDDVVVDISLSETEIDMTTEVLVHEVELLTIDTQKAVVEMPIPETMAVEQVFSPQKNVSDNVGVHLTFLEGSDNVGVQISFLQTDENVDAAVTHSTESESLKEQLKMESCEKVNYGELVQDLMIQPKSEKIVHEYWSSAANSFVDGENLDISVKIQQDISCKNDSGCDSQEEVTGKAIASDLSIHIGDYDSPDTDFFQQNVSSKQSDSKRKLVSEILSCHNDEEFLDHSEMPGSVEFSDEFSGGETFVDESDDEGTLDDDPESGSEAFDDNSCDTEAGFDFLESMQQDRKRESIASHVLCGSYTKEPADQSDTPDSFDSSAGFSSKVASYHQLVSGNSLTKESGLRVSSEASYCCSGIKKLSFDESQQASEVKSPSFSKKSSQTCPFSEPPVLPSRKAKITGSVLPLILADYPFTQKIRSSGVRLLEPTFKLKSNVSNDKENMEQSENKVEVTVEKRRRDKNEFPVCKKSDVGLNVRSPR